MFLFIESIKTWFHASSCRICKTSSRLQRWTRFVWFWGINKKLFKRRFWASQVGLSVSKRVWQHITRTSKHHIKLHLLRFLSPLLVEAKWCLQRSKARKSCLFPLIPLGRSRGGSLKMCIPLVSSTLSVIANAAGDGRKGKQGLGCPSAFWQVMWKVDRTKNLAWPLRHDRPQRPGPDKRKVRNKLVIAFFGCQEHKHPGPSACCWIQRKPKDLQRYGRSWYRGGFAQREEEKGWEIIQDCLSRCLVESKHKYSSKKYYFFKIFFYLRSSHQPAI